MAGAKVEFAALEPLRADLAGMREALNGLSAAEEATKKGGAPAKAKPDAKVNELKGKLGVAGRELGQLRTQLQQVLLPPTLRETQPHFLVLGRSTHCLVLECVISRSAILKRDSQKLQF